tara:strand:+ start:262 stop:642 length:381 start_codon:yes stop_codon:yes gene_type:complete
MALDNKKYEKFYTTEGSGKDKIDTNILTQVQANWDLDKAEGCQFQLNDPVLGPLVYQLQQMQDEIDALRTIISDNKDKVSQGLTTADATLSFAVSKDKSNNYSLTITIVDSSGRSDITKTASISLS